MMVPQNAQKCTVIRHDKEKTFLICIAKDCKQKNRYGCASCMKYAHSECKLDQCVFLNELKDNQHRIYPQALKGIQEFLEQENTQKILADQGIEFINQQFEKIKESFLDHLQQKQQEIFVLWKQNVEKINKIKEFQEKFEKLDLNSEVISIIEKHQADNSILQNKINQIVEKLNKKEEDLEEKYQQIIPDFEQVLGFFKFQKFLIDNLECQSLNLIDKIKLELNDFNQKISIFQSIDNQTIIKSQNELDLIVNHILGKKKILPIKFKLIFDTVKDGFSSSQFHIKCDSKKNILIAIESTEGERFGAFTSLQFSSSQLAYSYLSQSQSQSLSDGFNFLFNLNNLKLFSQNNFNQSICSHFSYGPVFGGIQGEGNYDLFITNDCDKNLNSSNFPICFGENDGAQQYSLTKSQQFFVKRYQVFQLEGELNL